MKPSGMYHPHRAFRGAVRFTERAVRAGFAASGQFLLILAILSAAGLLSCEKNGNNFLRSKKRMEKLLQGTWSRVELEEKEIAEDWTFENDSVHRTPAEGPDSGVVTDYAHYSLDAKVFRSFMTMEGFTTVTHRRFNMKFHIIRLDGEALVIYSAPEKGGSFMAEFVRK